MRRGSGERAGEVRRRRNAVPASGRLTVGEISVEVVRKRVKRLSLRVYPPDGRVRLTAPLGTPERELLAMVRGRAGWIERHRARFAAFTAHGEARYVAGEVHYLRGRPHLLGWAPEGGVKPARGITVEASPGLLLLRGPADSPPEAVRTALSAFYRRALREDAAPLLEEWQRRLGTRVSSWGVKRMSTRWGSCNPSAKRVWLNLELAKRRPELLEYVLVHELAHLFVPDHGPRFKALMTRLLPEWRELDAELGAWPIWARLPADARAV